MKNTSKKNKPRYSIADYAEIKGLNRGQLDKRISRAGIELVDGFKPTRLQNGDKGKKLTARYPLDYLDKMLYSVTDGWDK